MNSIVIAATSAFLIAGGSLLEATRFCTFAGYSFSVAIWTQHLWNLSIAAITYMILVHPLSSYVNNVERHIVWLWPAFWAVAMIVNGGGWVHSGFVDVGGYCSFNPAKGGALFPAIFLFVPRGVVVVVIVVLYTHLFFFLRRTDLLKQASHEARSASHAPALSGQDAAPASRYASRRPTLHDIHSGMAADGRSGNVSFGEKASSLIANVRRRLSLPNSISQNVPAAPYTDGSSTLGDSARTGSSSTQGKSSILPPTFNLADTQRPSEASTAWDISPKHAPVDIVMQQKLLNGGEATMASPTLRSTPPPGVVGSRRGSAPMLASQRYQSGSILSSEPQEMASTQEQHTPAVADSKTSEDEDDNMPGLYKPMAARRDVRDFGMITAPREHLRHYSLSAVGRERALQTMQRDEKNGGHSGAAVASGPKEGETRALTEYLASTHDTKNQSGTPRDTYDELLNDDWTWGMAVRGPTAAAGQANGLAGLAASNGKRGSTQASEKTVEGGQGRPEKSTKSWLPWVRRRQHQERARHGERGAASQSSSYDEYHVESLGSTLNRQASVLLLLYPAVYVILFSVSIIRIIVDLTSDKTPEAARARQGDALHEISRWTIFAQGAIDAAVFQLIERHFRARMKRKRRIIAGETVEDGCPTQVVKAFVKKFGARRSEAQTQQA